MDRRARKHDTTEAHVETIGSVSQRLPRPLLTCLHFILIGVNVAFVGCPRKSSPPPTASVPRASVALRVLVVNEPQLVEVIDRLRGEWTDRSGGDLSAGATTWKELAVLPQIEADVVVFPARYLGDLCSRGWLRPVRASVLESENVKFNDLYPLVRNELIRWGGQAMAVPLGVDATVLNPTDGTPAVKLLTLAAPKALSNERIGALFDTDTVKPRITEPAFVDALTQLASVAKTKEAALSQQDPAVSVIGYNDRLAAVTSSSRNAASAFKLLEWIARPDISSQLAGVGERQLPPRRSRASAEDWAQALGARLSGERWLVIPRIPAIDEYLAALEAAVQAATIGNASPTEALESASARWEEITNSVGRDKQRDAYRKHLGID